jgi:hypothetical protein
LAAKDTRERFRLNTADDGNTSMEGNHAVGVETVEPTGPVLPGPPLPDMVDTTPIAAAPGVETVRSDPIPPPLDTTPTPQFGPSGSFELQKTLLIGNTGVETVQANPIPPPPLPGMVNTTFPIAVASSGSFEPQIGKTTLAADTPALQQYQQPLPQTAGLLTLQPSLPPVPPPFGIPLPNGLQGPTNQDWNGMSGYTYNGIGGPTYDFGMQNLEGGFGSQTESSHVGGFDMLTESAQTAWLVAQNPAGNLGFDIDDQLVWGSGTTDKMYMPRPTDHPLPSSPAKGDAQLSVRPSAERSELGARIRKPAARKEVVVLTEIPKEEGGVPEWMSLAMGYLEDGIEGKEWLECVHVWTEFEKKIGLQNSTSVSTISQAACGSQSSPYTT